MTDLIKLAERVDRARRNLEQCRHDDPMRLHYSQQFHAYSIELEEARARASMEREP